MFLFFFIIGRRVCVNCKCPAWKHDIPSTFVTDENPFQRLGVEEIEPPLICDYEKAKHEGYQWLPREWLTSKVFYFSYGIFSILEYYVFKYCDAFSFAKKTMAMEKVRDRGGKYRAYDDS